MAKGFEVPNHTQTPNSLFSSLSQIKSVSELKIILAIIRRTFGWHKDADKISLSQLEADTGLTRESVCHGIQLALDHGYVTRKRDGQGHIYSLKVKNQLVKKSDQSEKPTSQEIRPKLVGKADPKVVGNIDPQKKGRKKVKKEEGASANPGTLPSGVQPSGILLLRDVAQVYPPKESWARYLEILGENPDESKLRKCRAEWVDRGYNKMSWKWFTEWYVSGMPERNGNNNGKSGAKTYEWQGRMYAYGDVVSDDGERYTVMGADGTPSKRWHTPEAFAVDMGITVEQAKHGMGA